MDNVKIKGHSGTFYKTIVWKYKGITYTFYESEQYGEDAPWVAINGSTGEVYSDIYNGVDDLKERLEEE